MSDKQTHLVARDDDFARHEDEARGLRLDDAVDQPREQLRLVLVIENA